MASVSDDAATIAGRFVSARRAAGGLQDYPGELPATLAEAYAVQDEAIAAWGQDVVGWKVGRINGALADRYGADRLAGPIFASQTVFAQGKSPEMPVFARGFAAAEAEFLLRIARTPPAGQTRFSLDEAAGLIDAVHVGIEIASSPLGRINALGPVAIISDFGNNNGLVVGDELPGWQSSGFEDWLVDTRIDDVEVGRGAASSFPNGAIGSARFLFELMAERDIVLRPGQWISSGAVSGVHDAAAGQKVDVNFGDRFAISCRLTAARPE
ncbi:MAG: 2-keto-4-pentenoate hydratase [Alphaproteobacteria bacterium]|nr:2-keto-4-pentenoate hydratase [Alphaproteobacteria bacterium]